LLKGFQILSLLPNNPIYLGEYPRSRENPVVILVMLPSKNFSFSGVRRIVSAEIDTEATTRPLWLNRGLVNVKAKFELKSASPKSYLPI
jgi:hypothetical protein